MSEAGPEQRPHRVDWLKVVAGALAAVSSALLLSTLGAAGTIVGAALGSVIVSLTSSFYSSGLDASRRRMSQAQAAAIRRVGAAQAEVRRARRQGEAGAADLTQADSELEAAKAELDEGPAEPTVGQRFASMPWKRVGLFAGGFFLCAIVVITGFELIAGKPVSSITGGTKGGGTSFSRFDHGQQKPSSKPSTPAPATATPQASQSPAAPATTVATSPSANPTQAAPSTSASAEPTDTGQPEQPDQSPTP